MLYLQYGHILLQCYTTAPSAVWVQFRSAPTLQLAKKPIGLALDTRIRNLFGEHGLYSWYISCDMAGLGLALQTAIERIGEANLQPLHATLVARQILGFGKMGLKLHDEVCRVFPSYPASPARKELADFPTADVDTPRGDG